MDRPPRFVLRHGNKLEAVVGIDDRNSVEAKLDKELTTGTAEEVDLYVYAGTYRTRRIAEKIDLFAPHAIEASKEK